MAFNNRNRSLLSLVHHTDRDLLYLLDLSRDLKRAKYSGVGRTSLAGKNIALIFEESSTRRQQHLICRRPHVKPASEHTNPWVLNLRSHPIASAQVGPDIFACTARQADAAELDR